MAFNEKYFALAYQLAEKGRGRTSPNPFVGAVLVKADKVIGTGFTQPYGQDHAEVQAIKAAQLRCSDADLYVTLEPCSHFGATPPCTDLIIENRIKQVFIGIVDPNPLVSGKGIQRLKDAGIDVTTGIWKDKIEKQLEAYIYYITKQVPYIFMKNAVTLDGKISDMNGNSRWISGEESRIYTHHLRQEADAVVTGIGTVLADDPMLNVRLPEAFKQPLRVVLDAELSIPLHSKIVETANTFPTLIIKSANYTNTKVEESLRKMGVVIESVGSSGDNLDLNAVSKMLYLMKKMQIMVEAGPRLCSSFLRDGLINKLYYFVAPKVVGGNHLLFDNVGVEHLKDALAYHIEDISKVGQDILVIAYPITE